MVSIYSYFFILLLAGRAMYTVNREEREKELMMEPLLSNDKSWC